jgi:molybdopterin-containing oxidoreductase family iron-sulfur binding subunit
MPADYIPGVPKHYASALELGGFAAGVVVTAYDGRPIKVEGNPLHPYLGDAANKIGPVDPFRLAAVLELYDPDRKTADKDRPAVQSVGSGESFLAWDAAFAEISAALAKLKAKGGEGLRVLSEATSSPTVADLKARFLEAYPKAAWVEYEPLSRDNERAGTEMAFGKPYRPLLSLDKAKVVLTLDADPLSESDHPAALKHARDFAAGRRPAAGEHPAMSRLYSVESTLTRTGTQADHRLALRAEQVGPFAAALAAAVAAKLHKTVPAPAPTGGFLEEAKVKSLISALADDLAEAKGAALVVAGTRQPAEVHALAAWLNAATDSAGKTVAYAPEIAGPTGPAALKALAADIGARKVEALLVLGGNPAYDAPADAEFGAMLAQVPTSVHVSHYRNETSRRCTWFLPRAHALESWGDARSYDGTVSVVQPVIAPLHGGKSVAEVLAALLGETNATGYELVRRTFRKLSAGKDAEAAWAKSLNAGFVEGTALKTETPAVTGKIAPRFADRALKTDLNPSDGLEVVFAGDSKVYDGRFANSGWLQELPEPATKIVWDNAAVVSPATAKALGVVTGSVVAVKLGNKTAEFPVYILPGQATGSVALALGYGRTAAGAVGGSDAAGVAPVGVDAYRLRTAAAPDFAGGLAVTPTSKKYKLVSTQNYYAIDGIGGSGLERVPVLVRETTLEEFAHHPDHVQHAVHHPALESLWEEKALIDYSKVPFRWGMNIDLSACIGCNSCVAACVAENNIPVIGKEAVDRGRLMHWIRVDRYFRGDPEAPQVVHQPVTCHHCENAPCEQVCPVNATVHDSEGLNVMVYNRCIGTKYCANNCPYKVRRFNWFNWHVDGVYKSKEEELLKLAFNPEVTVRTRGVMEKCTFCTHRINDVRIAAKNKSLSERPPIADGEIKTACQQACPTQAITFGNLNDPKARITAAAQSPRTYAMLAELNVKPRLTYAAKVRNPNPKLAGAGAAPAGPGHTGHEEKPHGHG